VWPARLDSPSAPRSTTRARALLIGVLAVLALVLGTQQTAVAYPPTPPSAGEAATMLNALTVATPGSLDGYDRDLFPHRIGQSGNCELQSLLGTC
jgi:hypothetical protein